MRNNIDELREKIVGNAEKEAKTMVQRAQKASDRILNQAKVEVRKIKEEAEERGRTLFEKGKSRIISREKMDEKKDLMILRKQLFEILSSDLEQELISLLKEGKLDFWIKSCCEEILKEEEKFTLVTNKEYIAYFEKICEDIQGISVSDENMKPGFLIRGKDKEYDFRFFVIAGNIINRNRKNIADKLGISHG